MLPGNKDPLTYLRDKFHQLQARMPAKKAAVAIAHAFLIAVFHILQQAVTFADLSSTLAILGRLEDQGLMVSRLGVVPPRSRPAPSAPLPPPCDRPLSRTGDRWPPGPASRAPAAAPRPGPPRSAHGRPAR